MILYSFIIIFIKKNGIFLKAGKLYLLSKICEIKYARIQGKNELEKHFENTNVFN